MEVDYEAVERARRTLGASWRQQHGFSLTYLPFIARAVATTLGEFPDVNATFTDDALLVHHGVNLGIAVDLNHKGLVVPTVQASQQLSLAELALTINDLTTRARAKKLNLDDMSGGTFTITNLGASNTLLTLPIINQPQVAILSTDGVSRRPVVLTDANGDEHVAIRSIGNLGFSWDHRAFDGAYAVGFLSAVRRKLQTTDWIAALS